MRPVVLIIAILASCLALPTEHSNLRIVRGKTAEAGQFPFVVAINVTDLAQVWCAGAIIHENWILTTATCTEGNDLKANQLVVVSGTNQLDTDAGVLYNVSQIVVHPNWTPEKYRSANIALLRIDGSFAFSNLVQPIELGEVYYQDFVVAAGWGYTENQRNPTLQYGEYSVWSDGSCMNSGPDEVCAFGGDVSLCLYDEGASLVLDGTLVGLGMLVLINPLCEAGYGDVFARVSYYKDWINNVIKS